MKKKFALLLVSLLILSACVFSLAACDNADETTFEKYLYNKYSNTMSFDEAELVINVAGDDKIVEYIPKECFMQEGQYMHIGDDYGYYI